MMSSMITYCRETFPSQEDVVDYIKSMLGMEDPSKRMEDSTLTFWAAGPNRRRRPEHHPPFFDVG